MVQVDVALPTEFGGAADGVRCTWAGDWGGKLLGVDSVSGQRVERYTFGADADATLFAHATCHRLEIWSDGFRGGSFLVTINGGRVLPGVIGSKKPKS